MMASEQPAPPAAATQAARGTPEAMVNALADAIEAGDLAAARRYFDGDASAQPMIDATLAGLIAAAQLRRAVADRFGESELTRLTVAGTLNLPDPRAMRRRRFTVEGDLAKEIPGPNERLVGPPSVRRIRDEWKYTMQIPPGTDPAKIKAAVEQEQNRATALSGVVQAIRDGKYPDADAMADDLRRQLAPH